MPSKTSPTPLIGDPARQAFDLQKGLVYQIWRSVEAWINLAEDELLFLEGAEDFDVVSDSSGMSVQIKATVGKITLRSETVISALNSFWLIKNNNPGKQIWLRYVTTSQLTEEQGNPFTDHSRGLELWETCAQTKDIALAEKLRLFLANDSTVSSRLDNSPTLDQTPSGLSLLRFLQSANAETVLAELIARVSWSASSEDGEVVKENVAILLRAFGENQRLRPDECKPALDRLFRVVAETASKKQGRFLSRDDFRLEFEQATSKRYSPSEITALSINSGMIRGMPSAFGATNDVAIETAALVQIGVPSVPSDFIRRPTQVNRILTAASASGGIVIKGSSGMGKSTLAKLAAAAGGEWIWADFQGTDKKNVPQLVRMFANYFIQSRTAYNLVLDNLDFNTGDLGHIDNTLAAVVRLIRGRNGIFIITTQLDLPGRLLQKMGLGSHDAFSSDSHVSRP